MDPYSTRQGNWRFPGRATQPVWGLIAMLGFAPGVLAQELDFQTVRPLGLRRSLAQLREAESLGSPVQQTAAQISVPAPSPLVQELRTPPSEEGRPISNSRGTVQTADHLLPIPRSDAAIRPLTPAAAERNRTFVNDIIATDADLTLVEGRPIILRLRQAPFRMQIADPSIADYQLISEQEISLRGVKVGTTVLNLWFSDPAQAGEQQILSYLIRVFPDPEEGERLDVMYTALEAEINRNFPNSSVRLSRVANQVIVRGQAKDVEDASQIIRVISTAVHTLEDRAKEVNRIAREITAAKAYSNITSQGTYSVVDNSGAGWFGAASETMTASGLLRAAERALSEGDASSTNSPNSRVVNLLEIAGVHQVMLKVTVAEVNRSAARAIGADIAFGGDDAGFFSLLPLAIPGAGGNFFVNSGDFNLAINALKTLNLARSLAEPNLVTLNGQPANFQVGGQFPVPVVTGATNVGLQGVDFVPFGVQLMFIPVVTDKNRIRLQLRATVSTRDEAIGTNINGGNVAGLNSRNFMTTVELREGQTLAIAGLIQNNFGANSDRVPLIGDVPILGRLFSHDRNSYDEQELVVLVTPHLVGPLVEGCRLPVPGSDMFEPDDLEFFLGGRMTSGRAEDYRTPVRSDLAKMKAFRRVHRNYIIGQSGYSDGR